MWSSVRDRGKKAPVAHHHISLSAHEQTNICWLPVAVTYRAVGDLIPDPRNARTHSKRQAKMQLTG
jgi:hypothetical protein